MMFAQGYADPNYPFLHVTSKWDYVEMALTAPWERIVIKTLFKTTWDFILSPHILNLRVKTNY